MEMEMIDVAGKGPRSLWLTWWVKSHDGNVNMAGEGP